MRLRQSVREHLEVWAKRGRRSVSEIAQELIEEGMRMRECPGIYFGTEPSGRTAKIAGTGLAVWEVLREYIVDQDVDGIRRGFEQLSQAQITGEIEANAALTPEVLEQRYPGLVRIVPGG